MPSLVLMEQGLVVSVEGENLAIQRGGQTIQRVKIQGIDSVLLFGRIQPTIDAIRVLLVRGVDTVFLTRTGEYRGRLQGHLSKNIALRMRQLERVNDPSFCAALAAAVVRGKIRNQRTLLLRVQRERRLETMADGLLQMRRLAENLEPAAGLDVIRGIEGRAAALYFPLYGQAFIQPEFQFVRRTRRPPLDRTNAMLSFAYTLLGTVASGLVQRAGLDPHAGFLHEAAYGRPSLMLDLIEEFRPTIVDSLVLRLVNRREIGPEDFEDPRLRHVSDPLHASERLVEAVDGNPPVYLNEMGRKIVFRAFQTRLEDVVFVPRLSGRYSYRQLLSEQVYHVARVIEGVEPEYVPFEPK